MNKEINLLRIYIYRCMYVCFFWGYLNNVFLIHGKFIIDPPVQLARSYNGSDFCGDDSFGCNPP